MMNISEFERSKPRKTYRLIASTISKYECLLNEHQEIMDLEDAALHQVYDNIVNDLKSIQKSFVSGE